MSDCYCAAGPWHPMADQPKNGCFCLIRVTNVGLRMGSFNTDTRWWEQRTGFVKNCWYETDVSNWSEISSDMWNHLILPVGGTGA